MTRRILNPLGYIQRWIWNEKSQTWQLYHSGAKDDCDRYAVCGAYGSCNVNGSPPVSVWMDLSQNLKKNGMLQIGTVAV